MTIRDGKTLLSRERWARAALTAITEGGVTAVSVDRLATQLGVTRGSFYWHFSERDEVIKAALELWARESTTDQLPALEAIVDPIKRLRALLRAVYEPNVDAAELALAAVGDDPLIAPIFARVTQRRMAAVRKIFTDLGLSSTDATDRAWLAYAFYLGHHQLRRNSEIARRQPERLERMVTLLTAGVPGVPPSQSGDSRV